MTMMIVIIIIIVRIIICTFLFCHEVVVKSKSVAVQHVVNVIISQVKQVSFKMTCQLSWKGLRVYFSTKFDVFRCL